MWQREPATYGYEVKGSMRVRERCSWRRDWVADVDEAEEYRHQVEWLRLTWWGRQALHVAGIPS